MRRKFARLLCLCGLSLPLAVLGQNYPERPINLVIGSSAGSSIDFVARTFGEYLSAHLGQPVIVDNRPGANGEIGTGLVARSKPDGYTLLLYPNNSFFPQLAGRSKFDVLKDFQPISISGRSSWALSVSSTSPFRSIKDVVDFGRREPGKLTYVSIGGGIPDLLGQSLADSAKIEILAVPYKSTSDAKADVMTGRVALWFTTPAVVFSMHESGLVRVLGVSGETQPDGLNNVPTMKQAGYEMLDVESTYFFLAPAGTPPAIVERLNSEINNAQKDQPVLDKLKSQGVLPRGGTVDAAVQVIRTELASWAKVIKVIPER